MTTTVRFTKSKKCVTKKEPIAEASGCLGAITPNFRMVGFTKGQFSLLDLITAVVRQTGPAALTVSTWSTGIRDTDNIKTLMDRNSFTSVRLLIDRSFPSRQPKYVADVVAAWGEENIRVTRNHAKFFILRNANWNIACSSSMNLNGNPRLEQFNIDDNAEICNLFESVREELYEKMPAGLFVPTPQCDKTFAGILGGGLSDAYNPDDLDKLILDVIDLGEKSVNEIFNDLNKNVEQSSCPATKHRTKILFIFAHTMMLTMR